MRLFFIFCIIHTICICSAQVFLSDNQRPPPITRYCSYQDSMSLPLSFTPSNLTGNLPWEADLLMSEPSWEKAIVLPKWTFEANSFYASGTASSALGGGLFSDLSLSNRLSILGVPVKVSGSLILQNGNVNSRLSSLGVEFDYERFLDRLSREKTQTAFQKKLKELPEKRKKELNEYAQLTNDRKIIGSEQYAQSKRAILNRLDSLSSGTQSHVDSVLLDSLQKIKTKFQDFERKVDSLYAVDSKKWSEITRDIQELREKVNAQRDLFDLQVEQGRLHRFVDQNLKKNAWKSILLNISKLKFGSYYLMDHQFSISGVPMHGVAIEVRRDNYYISISYGKEGKQNRRLPDYVRNVKLSGEGRTVFFARTGIGMPEKSHLHLSFSSIRLSGGADSVFHALPKQNVVISLESKYLLSPQFYLEVTAGLYNSDFTGFATSKVLLSGLYESVGEKQDNLAGLAKIGWKGKNGMAEYSIGYQIVGDKYVTLGNLFLLTNRKSVKVEGRQKFIKGRGQLQVSYTNGTTHGNTDLVPGIKQEQVSGRLSYRLNKRGSRIWGSYSPGIFLQQAPESKVSLYQLNLVTAGLQWMFKSGRRGKWMTVAQVTNFSDLTNYGDTSVVTGLYYGMITQSFLAPNYTFSVLGNVGLDHQNAGKIRDFCTDISQTFIRKHIQLKQGIQVIKRFYGSGLLVGGSAGIEQTFQSKLRIGLGGMYLFDVFGMEKNQFYCNASISWQLD